MRKRIEIEIVDERAVRVRMAELGIRSIAELAEGTGFTRAYIHKIVARAEDVSSRPEVVKAIAKALKASVEYVLGNSASRK